MGSIVTFYSYKGGVGRSMVLANVAVRLAQSGKRVLIVDWDLEAPGLERYLHYFPRVTSAPGSGLLPMLRAAVDGRLPDYREHVDIFDLGVSAPLALLSSGREHEPTLYARWLEGFRWKKFFRKGGGDMLEDLRRRWKRDYDVVLIDSRTGLSDTGGICTIQMPDVLVVMFTANHQSMLGARDAMRLVRNARQALAYPRMQLTVFPLPARFGVHADSELAREWLGRFADTFGEFYEDWLPEGARPLEVLDKVKVPQADEIGFGEQLAVVEEGYEKPGTVGHACDLVARVLKDDFRSTANVLGLRERMPVVVEERGDDDYRYDLFVSYATKSATLVARFVDELKRKLSLNIYIELEEIRAGDAPEARADALRHSRLLLPLLTPGYFRSRWTIAEWTSFEERERRSGYHGLIVPILLQGDADDVPRLFRRAEMVKYEQLRSFLEIAVAVEHGLRRAPRYRPDFPVIGPDLELPEVERPATPKALEWERLYVEIMQLDEAELLEESMGWLNFLSAQVDVPAALRAEQAIQLDAIASDVASGRNLAEARERLAGFITGNRRTYGDLFGRRSSSSDRTSP
jgi:MinD-like ATPase involved in chromosome partitioning or flagellar assembly